MGRPKLYVLTLQPLRERYTELWYVWFRRELSKYFRVVYIDGIPIEGSVSDGAFLPPVGAYYWELSQIARFIDMIRHGVIEEGSYVLVMDIEFPGHSWAVKHLCLLKGLDVKVYGWLHAGSYTKGDYTERFSKWQKWMELGWMSIFDGVFVASKYHKNAIVERRLTPLATIANEPELAEIKHKIHVVGNPFYVEDAWRIAGIKEPKPHEERDYDVIITDRPDVEKGVAWALAIAVASEAKKIAVCTGRREWRGWNFRNIRKLVERLNVDVYEGVSKSEYYRLLNNSKVWVTATQEENFGYCAVEAMSFNTQPVMPNNFAFPEHVDGNDLFLYRTYDEAVEKINYFLKNCHNVVNYVRKYEKTLDRVAMIILGKP